MTVSDRIFERLSAMGMTQKHFAEKAGLMQSTISEWRKKHTNPSSEKIIPICKALNVSPEWLLCGVDRAGEKRNKAGTDFIIIEKDTELWELVEKYKDLNKETRSKIMGYVDAMVSMEEEGY